MAALIIMGVGGALVSAGTQAISANRAGKAAESQAKAQKKAANRYAKALRSQASKLQGGMSVARQNTLKAGAALDRAALGQQARDEAKRGGQSPSVALEAELDASLQASMAQQQQMIDQMSQQEAVAKDAQRQALRTQALQTKMQAQAIDPEAIRKGATAPAFAQVGAALAQPAMQLGVSGLAQQAQLQGTGRGYDALKANKGRSAAETQAILDSYLGRNSGRGGSAT